MTQKDPTPSETRPTGLAPINVAALLESCMEDATVAALVIEKLESQLAADIKALRSAMDAKDAASVARTAHGLKGAAGAAGAMVLQSAAASLETLAKAGSLEAAGADLARLIAEVARCVEQLPAVRRAIGQSSVSDKRQA